MLQGVLLQTLEDRHCNVVLVSVIDIWLPGCIRRWGFGAYA